MYDILISALGETRVKLSEPLARHTYFKLGGPADVLYEANTIEELASAVQAAINFKVPYLVIGGGSNIIVTDKGFRGLVIKNKTGGIQLKGFTGSATKGKVDLLEVIVQSDSGVPSNKLIRYTVDEGLSGLEDMLGLPGTVGGAVYNNSHHLDKLIGERIVEVEVLDHAGKRKKYLQADMHFAYDYSILHKTKETILTVAFQLKRGDKAKLWEIATAAVKRRATTQPLGAPSSGCVFRNIPLADAMRIGMPSNNEGSPIMSAGYLVDKAGLKGTRVGGASVSEVHANFIVNDGTATATDVFELIKIVKKAIKEKYGVDLEMEVFVVGEK